MHTVETRGAAWYRCGICKKFVDSKSWKKHNKTKSHKSKVDWYGEPLAPVGTVKVINGMLPTSDLIDMDIEEYQKTQTRPRDIKFREKWLKDHPEITERQIVAKTMTEL